MSQVLHFLLAWMPETTSEFKASIETALHQQFQGKLIILEKSSLKSLLREATMKLKDSSGDDVMVFNYSEPLTEGLYSVIERLREATSGYLVWVSHEKLPPFLQEKCDEFYLVAKEELVHFIQNYGEQERDSAEAGLPEEIVSSPETIVNKAVTETYTGTRPENSLDETWRGATFVPESGQQTEVSPFSNSSHSGSPDARQETASPTAPTLRKDPIYPLSGLKKVYTPPDQDSLLGEKDKSQKIQKYLNPVNFKYYPAPRWHENPWWSDEKIDGVMASADKAWILAGASNRGRSHWHAGTARDDALGLLSIEGWNILVVADGAGSAKMSKYGSNRAVEYSLEFLRVRAYNAPQNPQDARQYLFGILQELARELYLDQEKLLKQKQLNAKDTYSTYMLLVHQPFENHSVFGTLHVGDGLVVGSNERATVILTQNDRGSVSNEAVFILSLKSPEDFASRARAYIENPIDFFMVITDGIENDLLPTPDELKSGIDINRKVVNFVKILRQNLSAWTRWEDWAEILRETINYERRGSNDDRTLAILSAAPNSTP